MGDEYKTKKQLINELMHLRQYIAELEKAESERKRVEEALRESEAQYRSVVEDQTEVITRFAPDTILIFVNDACCRYFGKTRDELVGASFMGFLPGEDGELVHRLLASLTVENPVRTCEHGVVFPGGEIRWQKWTHRAIFDDAGGLLEFQSVGRDITDRKGAEEALQRAYDTLEDAVRDRTAELKWTNELLRLEVEERKQAVELLKAQTREMRTLTQLILFGNKAQDLPSLLKMITESTLKLCDFEGGGIILMDEAEGIAELQYAKNLPEDFIEGLRQVRIKESPFCSVLMKKTPIFTNDQSAFFGSGVSRLASEALKRWGFSSLASVPLLSRSKVVGALHLTRKSTSMLCPEKKKLLQSIGREAGTLIAKMQAEQVLRQSEAQLKEQSYHLEEVNAALRVLLRQREEDKKELEEKVISNVRNLVLPYVERLRKTQLDPRQSTYISILENNLAEVISSFAKHLSTTSLHLTPREIQVASLLKQDKTAKEIAEILGLGEHTIISHRQSIREKLGLKNQKSNLKSFLQALQ
jgi:PAS domain S-box-containing protein